MSGESTTTTLNDVTNASVINVLGLDYCHDWVVATQFLREYSLIGEASAAKDIWSLASDLGTVSDTGAGFDTEFNATQGSDLSNTALDTNKVTLTASEYGVMRTLTDHVLEDSISGIDWLQLILGDSSRILMLAIEDDVCALFASLDTNVGTSGNDCTIANLLAAQTGIRTRGNRAPDGVVYVLDEQQVDDVEAALIATSTSMASYALSADRILGAGPGTNSGLSNGHVLSFRGSPVFSSGVTDTANTAADVVGACFIPSTPGNDPFAAFAVAWKRLFRLETQRDVSLRATEYVCTLRAGVGEINGKGGTSITTDAP